MSLEAFTEDWAFKRRVDNMHLEDRVEFVRDRIDELKLKLKTPDDIKRYFWSLKEDQLDEEERVEEVLATVTLLCERTLGEEWNIFEDQYTWDMVPRDVQIQAGAILSDGLETDDGRPDNRFGRIKTGEGKTLIGLFPIAYHALFGKVHVMTSNDYLAERDQQWIGPVLEKLGLSTAFLPKDDELKKEAYEARVLFGSDKEFSFDFLRDSVRDLGTSRLCEERSYLIVDEGDHGLLDELQTPIVLAYTTDFLDSEVEPAGEIISEIIESQQSYVTELQDKISRGRKSFKDDKAYLADIVRLQMSGLADKFLDGVFAEDPSLATEASNFEAAFLMRKGFLEHIDTSLYYVVDKKQRSSFLTERGMDEIESKHPELRGVFTFSDYESAEDEVRQRGLSTYKKKRKLEQIRDNRISHINVLAALRNALYCRSVLEKDKDYIVTEEGKVELINPSTGRSDPIKQYQGGLSQAIENKEGAVPTPPSVVVTSTTILTIARAYERVIAMSGTISPDQPVIRQLCDLESYAIPENKPSIRTDLPLRFFVTEQEKHDALARDVSVQHRLGRPVLIGTSSIEDSESLSEMLGAYQIPHTVLNAKNEYEESRIVAAAGQEGAVTVVTADMAGRGTDIKVPETVDENVIGNYIALLRNKIALHEEISVTTYTEKEHDMLLAALAKSHISDRVLDDPTGEGTFTTTIRGEGESQHEMDFSLGLALYGSGVPGLKRKQNQLLGRTARQGNPGSARFYASLEDELIKLSDPASRIGRWATRDLPLLDGLAEPIQGFLTDVAIQVAQETTTRTSEIDRNESLFYDGVSSIQRDLTESFRDTILNGKTSDIVPQIIEDVIETSLDSTLGDTFASVEELEQLRFTIEETFNTNIGYLMDELKEHAEIPDYRESIRRITTRHIQNLYESRTEAFGGQPAETDTLVQVLDRSWINQMGTLHSLRDTAGLYGYSGKDPHVIFSRMAHESFQTYKREVQQEIVGAVFHEPLPHELETRGKPSALPGELMELL